MDILAEISSVRGQEIWPENRIEQLYDLYANSKPGENNEKQQTQTYWNTVTKTEAVKHKKLITTIH